jgi:hypothetical protein
MSYISASELYNVIKGGTQRANPWAGILQEDTENDFKNQTGMEYAYDVVDGSHLTSDRFEMYEFVDSNVPTQVQSPVQPIPTPSGPLQWAPYTKYEFGQLVNDNGIQYTVSIQIDNPNDNVIAPQFSRYFTPTNNIQNWDPSIYYKKGDVINYQGKIFTRTDVQLPSNSSPIPPEGSNINYWQ